MLAYSGQGQFVLEALDLNRLIREMTGMLELSVSKKSALDFQLAPELPSMVADPTQVRQIVMNLAINASEAIGDSSGVISVATGCRYCDRSRLADTWLNDELPEGHYLFIEISDTGCGMEPETVERIFEPFFSTKFTGRGLGMAAILGIVRGHKGAIKVASAPCKGSSFTVYFPASELPAKQPDPEGAAKEWRGAGTVLLVDDEETIRTVAAEMLRELGFGVVTAADGNEALQMYRLGKDEIALVLMDLNMPRLSGEEAFHEMRRIDARVRVILSSGFSEQEVTRKFLGQGLAGFIQKPYSLGTLRDTLSRLL
jgi:two-component system cell cycle sensor histidine kinase/response regulator CckA